MSTRDLIGLVTSFGYAFGLLIIAEVIRRWRGYPQDFTRKFVHIGAGMWVFGVLALFENWTIGIIPFATFIVLNFIFYRFRLLESVDAPDSTPGTVYFALSITLLFLIFWRTNSPDDRGYIAAAGTMAMTWGDALAAIVGKRWGRHHYQIGRGRRSFEGSAAMFAASFVAMLLTLLLTPGSALSPQSVPIGFNAALIASLIAALAATIAEGVSPHGTDNLSVPLLSSFVVAGVLAVV
ncbi:MAG: phosphatidate cytidylyltransferase [Chloroflexus sp.]|jgi:dolichol kinase|nr:phosphatidate cytidylyltransferase [Chloroflexus sp.]MBO9316085.1 phosphatidate cytidylyltransferase [Chloroflexus sp.]MBO9318846.1 phosphatidate cytidylyltransferase [Chloroflexus sp.]MBO9337403.1 phosphatidate cytidylyltransferase [Chloroflexus sp.]MBO9373241.1 phosphatidate cytidylyltransferase [Chloroflexus sp.]